MSPAHQQRLSAAVLDTDVAIGILGSRPIFSLPNPGIGDVLAMAMSRDFGIMKNAKNYRILQYICPKNTFSPILGAVPSSKAESERIRTNTNYVIMAGIVLRAQSRD